MGKKGKWMSPASLSPICGCSKQKLSKPIMMGGSGGGAWIPSAHRQVRQCRYRNRHRSVDHLRRHQRLNGDHIRGHLPSTVLGGSGSLSLSTHVRQEDLPPSPCLRRHEAETETAAAILDEAPLASVTLLASHPLQSEPISRGSPLGWQHRTSSSIDKGNHWSVILKRLISGGARVLQYYVLIPPCVAAVDGPPGCLVNIITVTSIGY